MQTTRHILSITLILTILATGLPIFSPEDANRDSTVDIRDAILSFRGFVGTADSPAAFTENIKNVIFTMQALAGLKIVIKRADDAKSATTPPGPDLPYLISSFDFLFTRATCSKQAGQFFYYQSILSSPDSPPPRCSSIC